MSFSLDSLIVKFEEKARLDYTVADIDLLMLRDFMYETGLYSDDKPIEDYLSDRESIAELVAPLFVKPTLDGVLRPKNFTMLLFGRKARMTAIFPDAHTIVSIYPGTDRSDPTAERHIFTGSVIEQAKKAISLLSAQTYTAFDKTSNQPNQEKYPMRAVQEALINAIVHRDYEIPAPIRITVFSDRIEVMSPGALHWGVDKEKFVKGKVGPKWRNQSFAYLFNKLQLSQSEGQGISTIFRTMKEEGCPEPIFEFEVDSVTCILKANQRHLPKRVNRI